MTTVENKVAQLVARAKVVNDTFENSMKNHTDFSEMKAKVDEFDVMAFEIMVDPAFFVVYMSLAEESLKEVDKCLCICATIHNIEGVGNFEDLSEFAEPFKEYFDVDVDELMIFLEAMKNLF